MNWLDIVILIILLATGLRSFYRGFTKEVFGVIALIGAFIVAYYFFTPVGKLFAGFITEPFITKIVAFILLFIVVYYLINYVADAIEKLLKKMKLGFFDKVLGAAIGLIKGGIVIILILIIFQLLLRIAPITPIEQGIRNSKVSQYVIANLIPKVITIVEDTLDKAKEDITDV